MSLPDLEQLNEEELLCRAQRGSSQSFGVLAERYRPRLLRMLSSRVAAADAEDLAQETLVRAFDHLASYRPTGTFSGWLFTIAMRLAASHGRRRREAGGLASEPADGSAAPHELSSLAEVREGLWDAARAALAASQYEAIRLRYGRDLPVREVARAMKITTIHARVLLHRARKKLLGSPAFAALAGRNARERDAT